MKVNYRYVSPLSTFEDKLEADLTSLAGRLLEMTNSCTLIIGIDDSNRPFVLSCDARLGYAKDLVMDRLMESPLAQDYFL